MKNAKKASEIIRESWDWHGKKTQEFIINGKKIKTNLCADWSYYDGMGAPEKYSHVMGGTYFNTRKSSGETLDDLIAEGYDEIRFMLYASKMIRGYCDVYVFASNSTKAKERRAKERAQREAEKLEQAKAELQSNLSAHLKALDDERTADADQAKAERIHDQILETALEKAQESNSEAQAEAIQNGKIINPEKKYHVISWRIGAPIEEKTDCGIWDGSGMAHFSEGFGGFAYSSDGWLYFAQEASSADQLASLKAKREKLVKKQHHILERYGNNQESQSIFKEITEIDSQIKRIEFKIGAVVRIVDLDSSFYGEWGIIEKFDGSFYYLAMHGDHEHAPMIIKGEQIELASGKEA